LQHLGITLPTKLAGLTNTVRGLYGGPWAWSWTTLV